MRLSDDTMTTGSTWLWYGRSEPILLSGIVLSWRRSSHGSMRRPKPAESRILQDVVDGLVDA
jgi:hypothetical protein